MTTLDDQQAQAARPEDLYQSALNHYNELSDKAHSWYSSIPQGLRCLFFEKPELERALKEANDRAERLEKSTAVIMVQRLRAQYDEQVARAEKAEAALAALPADREPVAWTAEQIEDECKSWMTTMGLDKAPYEVRLVADQAWKAALARMATAALSEPPSPSDRTQEGKP